MLIPLHDHNPLKHIRFQYVTVGVIAACVGVFLYQLSLAPLEAAKFAYAYGAIPSVIFGLRELSPEVAVVPAPVTLITSMFLHGGWMHLIGNMVFLWVLGDNIEDAMGHGRFAVFYLVCGVAAALAFAAVAPSSTAPMIGASGAISGVIGAYLVLHPRTPIRTLFFYFILDLPAYFVLGLWIVFQVSSAYLAGTGGGDGGIAWWAHIGGLVAGAILVVPMRRKGVPLFDRGLGPAVAGPRISRARKSRIPDSGRLGE